MERCHNSQQNIVVPHPIAKISRQFSSTRERHWLHILSQMFFKPNFNRCWHCANQTQHRWGSVDSHESFRQHSGNEVNRGATATSCVSQRPNANTNADDTNTDILLLKWLLTASTQSRLNTAHAAASHVSQQSHPWRREGWSGKALECTAVATALKVASDCWHRSPATWKTWSPNEHVLTDTTGTQAAFADQENFDLVLSFWILTLEVFCWRTWPEMNLSATGGESFWYWIRCGE